MLTNLRNQTPESILAQIATAFGQDSNEYKAAVIVSNAKSFPISVPAGNMDFAGFRDYFCEMLQPIVLINGLPVKGNAAEAAATFMGKKDLLIVQLVSMQVYQANYTIRCWSAQKANKSNCLAKATKVPWHPV